MSPSVLSVVDISLKALTLLATTIVAWYVATISRRQWKTNQEKLRFDLYERRFDIYMRVLNFYEALIMWNDAPEQEVLVQPFMRAAQESQFLFPEESGVHAFFKEFSTHAFHITSFRSTSQLWGDSFPQEKMKLALARTEHLNWILTSLDRLNEKVAPFLNFHSL